MHIYIFYYVKLSQHFLIARYKSTIEYIVEDENHSQKYNRARGVSTGPPV